VRPPQAPRALRDAPTPLTPPAPEPAPSAPTAPGAAVAAPSRIAPVVSLPERTTQARPAASLSQRVREVESATRRVLLRRAAAVAAAVAVVVAVGWVAFLSPVFALDPDRVSVSGPEGQVDLAAARIVTDSLAGVPLPRLDVGDLEARIEEIPSVLDAAVRREWPRGLAVALTPRVPVAAVPGDGGVVLFGVDGVQIGSAAGAPPGVPVVDVPINEDTARVLAAVLDVLAVMPPELRAEVAGAAATSDASITFTLTGGATVRWGTNADNDLKLAVLQTLRQVAARVYDVSTPRAPITE